MLVRERVRRTISRKLKLISNIQSMIRRWGGYINYGYIGRGRRATTDGRGWENNKILKVGGSRRCLRLDHYQRSSVYIRG